MTDDNKHHHILEAETGQYLAAGSTLAGHAGVKRGPESWAYIYVMLGFALAIEGSVIAMITPLAFPWNLIVYALLASLTVWFLIFNGWIQDKLLGAKTRYESKTR